MTQAYAAEVKERFGNTDAYQEHQAKTASYSAARFSTNIDRHAPVTAAFMHGAIRAYCE